MSGVKFIYNQWRNLGVWFKNYGTTVHFWAPTLNWCFVFAGLNDMRKPPEIISVRMTGVLCGYSAVFMRYALMIQPKNYILFACHACNEAVQSYNLTRGLRYQAAKKALENEQPQTT
eukprot:GHVN01067791.1.p1 GENE.GHVN01067791.1~~GHVN01067791.1.p1  ORF type:complete len:117 (-),score=3.33 GHVN01067791.1:146-496(-)